MLNKFALLVISFFIISCEDKSLKNQPSYSIIFSSRSAFSYDIWYYDENLKTSYPLTKNRWNENSPNFYRDSSKVLFVSDKLGKKNIFSADVIYHEHLNKFELTNKSILFDGFEYAINPKISPSGSYVSFISPDYGNDEIFIFSKISNQINNLSKSIYKDYNQQFTPDGLSVIFQSLRGNNNNEIIMKSIDASLAINLTAMEGNDILSPYQSVSSSGEFFVFSSNRDGDYEIYRMNLDGTGLLKLTNNNYDDLHPIIDPSGELICFVSNKDKSEIYTMYSSGTMIENITNSKARDFSPIFSDDGKYISFLSDRDENLEVYVFSIESKELINISNNSRGDFNQQFIPSNN